MLREETVEQSYEIDAVHWPIRHRLNGGAKAVCLVAVSLCLGLCTSLIGPCLLVSRDELGIGIGEISRVFAGHAAGSLTGSFVGVFTSDSPALALLSLLLLAVGIALISWSNSLLLLAGSFTLQGLALGVLQTKYDESSSPNAVVTCAFHTAFGLGATAVPVAVALLISSQQSTSSLLVDGNGMNFAKEFQDSNTSALHHRVRRSANTTDDLSSQELSDGLMNQSSTTLTFYQTASTTTPKIKSKKPGVADGSKLNPNPKYADGRIIRGPIRENLGLIPSAVEDSGGDIGVVTLLASKPDEVNRRQNVSNVSQILVTLTTSKPEDVEFPKSVTSTPQPLVKSSTPHLEDVNVAKNLINASQNSDMNFGKHEDNIANNYSEIISGTVSMTKHPAVNVTVSSTHGPSVVGDRNGTFQYNSSSIFANTVVNESKTSDTKPSFSIQSPLLAVADSKAPFQASSSSPFNVVNASQGTQSSSVGEFGSSTTVQIHSSSTSKPKVLSLSSSIVSDISPMTNNKSVSHLVQHLLPSVTPLSSGVRTSRKPTSFSSVSETGITNSPKTPEHHAVFQDLGPSDSLSHARFNSSEQTTTGEVESVTANTSSAAQKHLASSKKTPLNRTSIKAVYAAISVVVAFLGLLLVLVRILSAKRSDSRGYHTALEQHLDQTAAERGTVARLFETSVGSGTVGLFGVVAILHFFRSGAEWTFTGLMPCFVQSRIGWTRYSSASLTASFWISFGVGRVASSSSLLSRRVTHRSWMVGGLVLGFVAMGLLNISISQHSMFFSWWRRAGIGNTALVWITSSLFGFGASFVSSAAERYVSACGGRCLKFAAVLGSCSGEMIVPLLSGTLSTFYGLDWVINTAFAAVAGCLAVGLVLWYIAPANVGAKDSPSLLVQMLGDSIEAVSRTSLLHEDSEDVATETNDDEEAELLSKNSSSILSGDNHSVGSHLSSRARIVTSRTPKGD